MAQSLGACLAHVMPWVRSPALRCSSQDSCSRCVQSPEVSALAPLSLQREDWVFWYQNVVVEEMRSSGLIVMHLCTLGAAYRRKIPGFNDG